MPDIIEVKNITSGYQNRPILKGIDFSIREGEFFGIIGPNGSGKSTLLKTLSRCLKPYQGSVHYKQKDIHGIPAQELAKEFAFVAQDTAFNFSFTVWEIVQMGRIPYIGRMRAETPHDLEITKESMRTTDTLALADRFIGALSSGERQMVLIAKALAQQPKVLFLDEPTSHLDIGHQVQIMSLIKELNQKHNITVIVVLHDLNLASEYCDRLLLLNEGRAYKLGEPEEILTFQNIEEVYKTLVIVNRNPITKNPHILLVSKEKT
ncbi:MAG: ABC transporter ATP-binding protein [Candidatus Omnitrophota bacterium]